MKRIFLIVLLFVTCAIYAQRRELQVSIPSPNAASLGVYGEIPVSYFTGLPNISIPLYELKGNRLSVPVSLQYHAAGLRPDIHPGWLGNGWSISAGGIITRISKGTSTDENYTVNLGKVGYYYNHSNLNNNTWSSSTTLNTLPFAYTFIYQQPGYQQYFEPDVEPDEFIFNFLNYSGRFFLDQTGNWQVQCDKALKVIFDPNDFVDPFTVHVSNISVVSSKITKTFGKFTILDEKGNKYIFGSTDQNNTAIEFSDVMIPAEGQRGASIAATSWYLSQIISADNSETIDFTYERGPLQSFIDHSYFDFAVDNSGGGFLNLGFPCTYTPNNKPGFNGRVLFPVYLTSISMPSMGIKLDFTDKSKSNELTYKYNSTVYDAYGKVYEDAGYNGSNLPSDFPSLYMDITASSIIPYYTNSSNLPSSRWERFIWLKLDALYVRKISDNSIIRQFDFWYNNDVNKRLQLDLLRIKDKNNLAIQEYAFTYNSTALPNYMTIYGDHWGFNNYSTTSLIGTGKNFYQYRQPDATGVQTQAEILTSIKYPTGGTTSFVYEPNTYSQVIYRIQGNGTIPTSENGIAGGLRVKQVSSSDGMGNTHTKEYYYVNGYTAGANPVNLTSSGILDSKPQYTFDRNGLDDNGNSFYYRNISSNPVIPLTTGSTGTHIGYSKVVEKLSDGSYTIYEFSNHDNFSYRDLPAINARNIYADGYAPCISMAYKRGKLLSKIDKDNLANSVQEEFNTYVDAGPGNLVNAVFITKFGTCPESNPSRGVTSRVAYQLYTNSFFTSSKMVKVYSKNSGNTPVISTTNFLYNQYRELVQIQTTDSKGQSKYIEYKYPDNFISSDPTNPYNLLTAANRYATVVESQEYIGQGTTTYITKTQLFPYKSYGDNKIYNDEIYEMDLPNGIGITDKQITTYNHGANLSFDSRYRLVSQFSFDGSGNISTLMPKDDLPIAYIWDYNQKLPVAKVFNGNNTYASGSANTPLQASFTKDLSGTPYITYTYPIEVPRTGNVNLLFRYNNEYISGNNSSVLAVALEGVSNPSFYSTGNLCAKTIYYTSGCTNNTFSFTNVPVGSYKVKATVVSVNGFQNYYGYKFSVDYPSYRDKIVSANSNVAYSSFETGEHNNWTGVITANVTTGFAPTGEKYYLLGGKALSTSVVSSSSSYIVSYWSNTGSPYLISGSQLVKTGRSINGWMYFEHLVSGVSSVTVSGSGGIDELRLYPSNALMTTFTYNPIIGMTSACDENNKIIYYEYDAFGRLSIVRDFENNIIKKICYSFTGMVTSCN